MPIFPIKVSKVWGEEIWFANSSLYCGKILLLKEAHFCSYHYHKLKDETFYILEGTVRMNIDGVESDAFPGISIHIPPETKHMFTGLEDSVIIETSTEHFEDDSYRQSESGKL